MRKFGLIGRNITHSFSEKYFTEKFSSEKIKDAVYKTYDLKDLSQIENLLNDPNLIGFNVTIPFKELIIPYLDELSTEAKAIGAVNCVKLINGKKLVTIQMLMVLKSLSFLCSKITMKMH